MVVDHSDSLHEGVANRPTHESESASLQDLAHGIRFGRPSRYVAHGWPEILFRLPSDELPRVLKGNGDDSLPGSTSSLLSNSSPR